MKIASASKKVLASALSAAMVVAFAPTVAFGDTFTESAEESVKADTGETVAVVTYTQEKDGKTKAYTNTFTSTDETTDDEALQRALDNAAAASVKTGVKKVTVTLAKDVTTGNITNGTGREDKSDYTYGVDTLTAGGNVTIDLAGHTIKNAKASKPDAEPVVYAKDALTIGAISATTASSTEDQAKTAYAKDCVWALYNYMAKNADLYAGLAKHYTMNIATTDANGTNVEEPFYIRNNGGTVEYYFKDSGWLTLTADNEVVFGKKGIFTVAQADAFAYDYNFSTDEAVVDYTGVKPYKKYNIAYKTYKAGESISVALGDADVKIINGTVSSSNGKNAIQLGGTTDLTLGEGAVVKGSNVAGNSGDDAYATIHAGSSTTINLQEGATVEAASEGEQTKAIYSWGTVKVALTDDQADAKVSKRDIQATVKATVTDADAAADKAVAIDAATVSIEAGADISASSDYAPSTDTSINPGDSNTGGVIINTPGVVALTSTAVKATSATLNYGTYTAETAVDAAGTIKYGTYNGYVAKKMNLEGGKFQYNPEAITYAQVGSTVDPVSVEQTIAAKHSVTSDDAYYYVYRDGVFGGVDKTKIPTGVSFDAAVPEGAVDANGNPYLTSAALTNYVNDKYLEAKTAEIVLSQDEVGVNLNDGNETPELTLNLAVTYANPYSAKDVAANQEAFDVLNAQAEAAKQHVQGIYTVAAELDYDKDKKGDPIKYQDVESLGDAALTMAMAPVTVDSKATVYAIGETATALETSTANAILPGAVASAKVTTAEMGAYGVTYSTAEDLADEAAQKAAEEAQKQIDELSKELGTVIDTQGKTIDELNAIIASLKAELADKTAAEVVATQDRNAVENVYATKTKTIKLAKGVTKTKKAQAITYSTKVSASGNVVTYAKRSGSSKITVDAGGTVKLAKGVKKGTYTAKVKVTCGEQTRTVTAVFVVK